MKNLLLSVSSLAGVMLFAAVASAQFRSSHPVQPAAQIAVVHHAPQPAPSPAASPAPQLAQQTAGYLQNYNYPSCSPVRGYYPGASGYGYGNGYHASTYEQGVLQGYASVLQAQGQLNYLNSQAAINNQEANSRYIRNRELATETYFRNRQINLAAHSAERSDRLSTTELAALAKKAAPDRLDQHQYDSTVGRLTWPAALAGDDFAADRNTLDRAFRSRSPGDSGPDSAFYGEVRQVTNSMQVTLKNKIAELDSAQYVAAKKFLMGLSYESQQPMVVRALAAM